jgi:hypothetical protein
MGHDGVGELLEAGADHSATAKVSGERKQMSGVLRRGGAEPHGKRKRVGVGGKMLTYGRGVTVQRKGSWGTFTEA